MNELKWTLGEPCIRSLKPSQSPVSPISSTLSELQQPIEAHVPSNKREMVNEKMNERLMISQINQNPFLVQNKYLDDLYVQETFLKPKNSNLGYEKN